MDNRICGKCGSRKITDAGSYAGSSFFKCKICGQLGMKEKFPKNTLFHKISASVETLANELVTLDCDGWWAYVGIGKRKSYPTREEAFEVTVEKLKEVAK